MSDVQQGPGWWQASDGRWYPPHLHPDFVAPPPPIERASAEQRPKRERRPKSFPEPIQVIHFNRSETKRQRRASGGEWRPPEQPSPSASPPGALPLHPGGQVERSRLGNSWRSIAPAKQGLLVAAAAVAVLVISGLARSSSEPDATGRACLTFYLIVGDASHGLTPGGDAQLAQQLATLDERAQSATIDVRAKADRLLGAFNDTKRLNADEAASAFLLRVGDMAGACAGAGHPFPTVAP